MVVATVSKRASRVKSEVVTLINSRWEKKNAPPSLEEVKKAIDELLKAVHDHKKINDDRLSALERNKGTAEYEAKLEKLNSAIDKGEKVQAEYLAAQKKKDEEAKAAYAELEKKWEARFNRSDLGGGGDEENEKKKTRALERKAYDKFLRYGKSAAFTEDERKVLTVGNDATGGYLAPPEMVMEIIKGVVEFTPFRSLCRVFSTSRGELLLPKRTQTAAATRVGEISQRNETQNPAWGMMSIQTPEMFAKAHVSKHNLEDSAFDLAKFIVDEFREQFGVKEGQEAITGIGVTQLLGILDPNAGGPGVPFPFTVSGSAATIAGGAGVQADGLINLFYAVKTAYAARGRWILNRNSLGAVRKLKDTTGAFLWQPPLAVSEPATILGAPYTECPDMPNEGANAFPIGFGDWQRAYAIVDRVEIDMVRDDLTLADVGQVKFTGRRRVGGQPILIEAARLLKCSV